MGILGSVDVDGGEASVGAVGNIVGPGFVVDPTDVKLDQWLAW
jgi:hypothetical protein